MKKLYYIIYIGILMLLLAGCQDEGMFTPESDGDEPVYVTYRVNMGDETLSRAIGDAKKVNELKVGVFQDNQLLKIFTFYKAENAEAFTNVTLPLLKQETYDLVFWAQTEENGIYSIDDNFNITIDYAMYQDISLAKTEEFEAFTVVKKGVTVANFVANPDDATVELKRPFAQLNIAASEDDIFNKVNKVSFTIDKVYKKFNPLTGVFTDEVAANQEFLYSFSGQDIAAKQAITIEGANYYYLASAYLLAPEKVKLTGGLYKGDELVKELKVTELPLKANNRTNIYGDMIQQEELKPWDGVIPTESPLTQDDQNRYIIDEEADLAWLSVPSNVAGLSASTFIVTKDVLNMGNKTISSIQLPAGSTFNGNGKTIKNYANSLFGDATALTVKDLTVENITVSGSNHIGTLANTLKGSSSFTNVFVSNSTVTTTNGAAGGMVGYIVRTSEMERSEILNVSFTGCKLNGVSVSGSTSEGKFVGLLSGYDNNESLSFDAECEATDVLVADYTSVYTKANNSAWVTGELTDKYDGWLGHEIYRRAKVTFGGVRLAPRWDGVNTITPLTDGITKTKLIYSAFDLANCAGTNPGTIKFMENVDLGAKVFNPLTNLSKLIGENKTIYNLKVETTFNDNSWDGGGFVRRCSTATIENITFQNADVKVTHVAGTDGDAYASIVCGTAEGTNTMTNVKVIGGKLYGCNKMGGIAGYITGTFTATNCVVDGLSIQNYDSGGKDKLGFKANGEVGGAFGFLAANSTISGCYVKNTTLNCVGVNNGKVLIFFKYAGRHVNEFIGDIRTTSGQTIRITLDEKNFTGNSYKNRKDQYSGCKYIGHCYYTSINAVLAKIEDTKGTVYVNNKSITVAQNY